MDQIVLGRMLREYRERNHISQEELCAGEQDVANLSRLENGKHVAGRKCIESFFERLGMDAMRSLVPITEAGYNRFLLEKRMERMLEDGNYELLDMIARYRAMPEPMDVYEEQFLSFCHILYDSAHGGAPARILERLVAAMRTTAVRFVLDGDIGARNLAFTERRILLAIARAEYALNRRNAALFYVRFLADYMEAKTGNEQERFYFLPQVLHTLSQWQLQDGHPDEAATAAQKGVALCSRYGDLRTFPALLFDKGCAQLAQGQTDGGGRTVVHALEVFTVMGLTDKMMAMAQEADAILGTDFCTTRARSLMQQEA